MTIRLAKRNSLLTDEHTLLRDQYSNWKFNMDKNNTGAKFFILYKDFEDHLKDISSGALKLYLYYGFSSKNETGESWHSIDTISSYFNVSEKTINNWNNELIERGLIYRLSRGNSLNKVTYLMPFTMNYLKLKDNSILNNIHFNQIYGRQFKAFHLFQWRQGENSSFNIPYHTCILIYKKDIPRSKDHYTAFEIDINHLYKDICIDESVLKNDIYNFDSPLDYHALGINLDVDVKGIAINTQYNLKRRKIIYDLVKELNDEQTDFDYYEYVNLIDLKELKNR